MIDIRIVDITNCIPKLCLNKKVFLQIVQQDSMFEMMTLAQDMGMDKLKTECEDHVISTMKGKVTN